MTEIAEVNSKIHLDAFRPIPDGGQPFRRIGFESAGMMVQIGKSEKTKCIAWHCHAPRHHR